MPRTGENALQNLRTLWLLLGAPNILKVYNPFRFWAQLELGVPHFYVGRVTLTQGRARVSQEGHEQFDTRCSSHAFDGVIN